MNLLKDERLYTDTDYCLEFLKSIPNSESIIINESNYIAHAYWYGPFAAKQALSIKSYLATQDMNKTELWLWLDEHNGYEGHLENPFLKPLLPLIKVKKYSPVQEAKGTPLDFRFLPDFFSPYGWGKKYLQKSKKDLAHRADIFRILILYKYGGLYFDLDVLFLRDFSLIEEIIGKSEYCYQWATQNYANSAILKLKKAISTDHAAHYLIKKGIKKIRFKPWSLFNMDDKDLMLDILPSTFFDTLWMHFDNVSKSRFSPMETFEDFFKEIPKTGFQNYMGALTNFLSPSMAYHWHNCWSAKEYYYSGAGYYNRIFDKLLREKFNIEPYDSFSEY